jgi:hypothetical protein
MKKPAASLTLRAFRADATLEELKHEALQISKQLNVIVDFAYYGNRYHCFPADACDCALCKDLIS